MIRFFFIMMTAIAALAGCAAIPTARYSPIPPLPEGAHPAPVGFSALSWHVPTGAAGGQAGSGLCLMRFTVESREIKSSIKAKDIRDTFHDTMQDEGYDVTGSPDLVFDEEMEDDKLRAEYKVAGAIVAAQTDSCYHAGAGGLLSPMRGGFTGSLYLKIRWHVFDALRRTSVYTVETEGYAQRGVPNPDGIDLLMNDAFAMAAHNLGADAAFRDLIVHGVRPDKDNMMNTTPDRPRRFDDTSEITIAALPASRVPFERDADDARRAAVLVEGGYGHGSGFFIGRDGYILTASHVVGDALHVRIVPSDRGSALVAEVVRSDKARDVALLRLMDPYGYTAHPQPLRLDWPKVGERVYAIGAPRGTRLQDSVTSGIVSAWRKNFVMLGTRQDFIQSDVTVQPGNSGGPLLDATGNVVGIDDAGVKINDTSVGLNYFIPIDEALKALRVQQR